jgi:hypothetical protein
MVIEVDSKIAAVEYHGHHDPEGEDRPPRLVIW